MLGVLVSGRLPQTNYHQVSPNKIVFLLDNATDIHNISVFMTGTQPFPQGMGAVVYFSWPPYEHWSYLGWITNDKPSIMLRVKQVCCAD
jgi:protein Hikeshi